MREIRMLRAMWRGLETGLRTTLHGHEGGNPGYGQGESYRSPRQSSTLPGYKQASVWILQGAKVYPRLRRRSFRIIGRLETQSRPCISILGLLTPKEPFSMRNALSWMLKPASLPQQISPTMVKARISNVVS